MINSRLDGRHARSVFVQKNDNLGRMVATIKTATGSVGALTDGLTEPLGGSAVDQSTSRKDIARDYLRMAQGKFAQAALTRVRHVVLAKQYGLTNAEIGEEIGVSESAVRKLIKRHGDA